MSAQTMDSLGPYTKPTDPSAGIAGGSPTFARLQGGGARRPMWMTAAPIAVIIVAAGAAIFAISANTPASTPVANTPAVSSPATASQATPPQATADQAVATKPTPPQVAAVPTRAVERSTVTVHRVSRAIATPARAPSPSAASAQGRDVYATTPAAPSPTVSAPAAPPTAPILTQPAPDAAPAAPQTPQAPTPNPAAEPQTPPNAR